MYVIEFTVQAQKDVIEKQKHNPKLIKKLAELLEELREHPRTGTGQVEQLRYFEKETWSRRLNREHRLVYEIHENEILVLIVSAYGHYSE